MTSATPIAPAALTTAPPAERAWARRVRRPWSWLLPLALAVVVFLPGLGTPGIYAPNEGIYADIGWEMFASGDWISPRFNGVPYFEKPILHYWLIAAAYRLFGASEVAARLPVALSAVAAVLGTFGIGRTLFGPRAGLIAAMALTTSLGQFVHARQTKTDLLLAACVTATVWCFLQGYLHGRRRAYLLAWGCAGLGVLAKGLLGLAIPALIVGGLVLATREWRLLREVRPAPGTLVFLVVVVPWYLAVEVANRGFLWFFFVNEHVLRFLNHRHLIDYSPVPVWLFLLVAMVWGLPWSLFAPFGWRRVVPFGAALRQTRAVWIVPCWIVGVLGLFAATPARLEYYSLPILPAVALLAGRVWDDALADPSVARALRWPLAAFLGLGTGLGLLTIGLVWTGSPAFPNVFHAIDAYSRDIQEGILAAPGSYTVPPVEALLPLLALASVVLVIGSGTAIAALLRRRPGLAVVCLIGAMLGTFPAVHRGLVLFDPHRSVRELAARMEAHRRAGDVVVVEGPYENFAGLGLYTRGYALVFNGRFGDLEFGSHRPSVSPRFLDDPAFEALWNSHRRVFLLTLSASRAEALLGQQAAVLGRSGPRWLFLNRS